MHIWTVDEIQKMEMFGEKRGWFYGIVRHKGRLHFGEIYPGLGYASPCFPTSPKWIWRAIKDVYKS